MPSKLPKRLRMRTVYTSDFINLHLDKVETHKGRVYEHHVLESPKDSVVVIVKNSREELLVVSCIRYVQGIEQSLEFVAGGIDHGEEPVQAAKREFLEETGYTVKDLISCGHFFPTNSMMTQKQFVFVGDLDDSVARVSFDEEEVLESCWMSVDEIKVLIREGSITCGVSLGAFAHYLLSREAE